MYALSRPFWVILLSTTLVTLPARAHENENGTPIFERIQLSDQFLAEGAHFADFNRDGAQDVVSGPYWYAGPDYSTRLEIYPAEPFHIDGYSRNFLTFTHDFNGDEWPDVLVIGFPGEEAAWYENPGGKTGHWPRHVAFGVVDNESPAFTDVNGDRKPELVFHTGGRLGYAEYSPDDPRQPWKFHAVSEDRGYDRFNHGFGVGDVNGDGRPDLLERNGWWEQPAAGAADGKWAFHAVQFSAPGGAQMYAYDLDGDGDNDVITSDAAHAYGLSWFENIPGEGGIEFRRHQVMGERPEENEFGVAFSQLHAIDLADMDGDGLKDIVTGKRFWAHKDMDPGSLEPAVLYWFQTVRDQDGVRFVPHRVDQNSGVGTQVVVGDVSGDERPDIVVGNKKGTFLFIQHGSDAHNAADAAGAGEAAEASSSSSQEAPQANRPDVYPHRGLSATEAAKAMKLPEGFSVQVFAAEPDVQQPIAMTLDDRGRLWIAEAYEYPQRAEGDRGRDRILIFEDTNHDGRFDNRKVFVEGLNLVSGLEVGFGGVWVGAAPYLMFIPDRDGNDVPDAEPEVLLDGWGYQDTHETLNAFIWGPDGWLYGCHGVFTHSRVGKPGTPDEKRHPINAGIWRYHPTRHEFEVFAHGTSNPWGVDFDDHGQAFCTACVIPHLFHVIQGARYHRQAGQHFNPHTYADIPTIADHLHYLGEWAHAGNGRSDQVGGGHAHAGAMIYMADAWPAKYRGKIFMNNIHGQRLNMDQLQRRGSGFVGTHGPDFLLSQDLASQMLYFRYGPDGQVYVIDWYDMQACHDPNVDVHDRSNGRIYKINYGQPTPVSVDLATLSDLELAEHCLNPNDWYVRHARRILQERATSGKIDEDAKTRLLQIARSDAEPAQRLRALWALHGTSSLPVEFLNELLADRSEYVRAWAIQLALEKTDRGTTELLPKLAQMAREDDSPVVRLYLASAADRLPVDQRWDIVAGLITHGEDASDHNLPLMVWYAAEPLAEADPERALALGMAAGETIPQVRKFMIRRIVGLNSPLAMRLLVDSLAASSDESEQLALLGGMRSGLEGQRRVDPPSNWDRLYAQLRDEANDDVRLQATALGVKFGDERAQEALRELAVRSEADARSRRAAVETLLAAGDPGLAPVLHTLLHDADMREMALRGLAQYDDSATVGAVLALYGELLPQEKRAALATLSARPAYAKQLLQAVMQGKLAAADLSAHLVNQLLELKDAEVSRLVGEVWGRVRATPEDKANLIQHYKQLVSEAQTTERDLQLGRAIFAKTCQQCHTLYGVGNTVGPDITGANRADLEYLLSNVVDPSGLIAKEYQTSVIVTADGRVVTGVVAAEDDHAVTIRNDTETLVIPKDEIDDRELTEVSLMPEDQLKQFTDREIAALFAYLQSTSQVPMLATRENAATLFNGRDLAGWHGDSRLWSVEDGEIVGRSPGLDHNSFLISDLAAEDFRLRLEVKLVPNEGNSGIQFRSRPENGYEEVHGYQADMGAGWWGKLYEENGRAVLWDKPGEHHVRPGQWNQYEIHAEGNRIRTWINGQLCVDLNDPAGSRNGIFALQVHSGPAMEVRFRNLELEVLGDDRATHSE